MVVARVVVRATTTSVTEVVGGSLKTTTSVTEVVEFAPYYDYWIIIQHMQRLRSCGIWRRLEVEI